MPIEKGLLLKGLGVCAICAGGATVALKWKDINSAFYTEKRISVAGLECEDEEGGDCNIKDAEGGGKILVKKEESSSHFEVTSLGEGKIKVYRTKGEGENPKNDVFKFVIEEADIGSGESNKLEEFETYEVKKGEEEGLKGKEYLFLKTKAKEGIKKALGLPWDLPDGTSQDHANISNTDLKDIKFKGGTASISGGTVTLTISKDSSKDSYPFGYKFTFKNNAETDANLSYGSKKVIIKKGIDVDFGIRRDGKNLFLDSWSLEDLAEKVGLKKGNDGYWTIGESGLNIKQGSNKEKGRERLTNQQGKIKVYEGQDGYYQGLKFSVELGDLGLKTKQDSTINVLGQYETYEIKKDEDGTWYLSRVKDPRQTIKTSLGLPCELPTDSQTSVECSGEISTIKFSGGTATTAGSPKLTIHKENLRVSYPLGYRFSFTSTSDTPETSITIGNEKKVLKQGVDVDFKIKLEAGGNMSLEGWTLEALMKEIYFKKEGEDWTLGDGTMNIKQEDNKTQFIKKKGNPSGKIKLQKEVPGYNQGFKFSIEDGNLNLEEEGSSITALNKYETYEVSLEDDGYFYFSRKKKALEVIKEKLGFPEDCIKSSDSSCQLDSNKLNGIKFSGKGESNTATIGEGGTSVTMKVDRGDSNIFPMGHRFTLISEKEITFTGSSAPAAIKANTNTEFKIKEEGGNLTLERAWDAGKLGGKVGLTECGSADGGSNKCSFGAKISVYESDDARVENATVTDGTSKKITYQENQANYNQGFKFKVEENISLGNGSSSGNNPPNSIKKDESGTEVSYQIMEKTPKNKNKSWYLVKKS